MPSFGEQLRQARESQNITLQEIAATTKISSRALQALESEQFDQLPGGIFNKGFVRAYARYVGLDEEQMLAAYRAAAKNEASETDMQTVSSQIAASRRSAKESRIGGTTLMSVLAVIVALALGAVWYREHRREVREQAAIQAAQSRAPLASAPAAPPQAPEAAPPEAGPTSGTAEAVPPGTTSEPAAAPAATAASPNPAPNTTSKSAVNAVSKPALNTNQGGGPPNPEAKPNPNVALKMMPNVSPTPLPSTDQRSGPAGNAGALEGRSPEPAKQAAASAGQAAPLEVSISATQKAWISVTSDGKKLESLTLDPDKPELRSRSYKANQKLKVVVGNAGGVTAVWNGKSEGPLGAEGQAKTVTFTPQGIIGR